MVALESTIISHGLPRPGNYAAARKFEELLEHQGVTPATIAVIDGVPKVGLSPQDLERIAADDSVVKVSSRDIAIAIARKVTGGTTVAATSVLAARAGLRVFATGGLGGVHLGAAESFDESADLTVLSRTPITVVSAGVKSILGHPRHPGSWCSRPSALRSSATAPRGSRLSGSLIPDTTSTGASTPRRRSLT